MKHFFLIIFLVLSVLRAEPCLSEQTQLTEQTPKQTSEKSSSAQRLGAEPQVAALLSKSLIALGFLSLVTLCAFGLRAKLGNGLGRAKTEDQIKVLSRKSLSPKHALLIVEVSGEQLLLAQTSEQLTLLTKLDEDTGFAAFLKQADFKDGKSNLQIGGV